MASRALIIGINSYGNAGDLQACVADAEAMTTVLSRHKDKKQNFDCVTWLDQTDAGLPITRGRLRAALTDLFAFNGDALLYFSGHGFLSRTGGLLCTSDATEDDWGVPMQDIVNLSIGSQARQILIVLDCCHAGAIGNPVLPNAQGAATLTTLRENMTIIAAPEQPKAH